jgi:hypothetical protein
MLCGSDTDSVFVNVIPTPSITASASPSAICIGGNSTLTASGAGAGGSYLWTANTALSGTVGSPITATPNATTTFTVNGTNSYGCSNSATVTVTIYSLPPVTITPSSAGICEGDSVQLTAGGASSYVWSPASVFSTTTGSTKYAKPLTTTTVTVTGTDGYGCFNSATATITVTPKPTITATASPTVICAGNSSTLTGGGAGTGATYLWSPSTGLSPTNLAVVTASPNVSTTYTVRGTTSGGCFNTASVLVTVNAKPNVSVSASPNAICVGQSSTITANGAITYTWSPTSGLSPVSGSPVSASPSSTTLYTVSGTDGNGCTNSAQLTLTVYPLPSVLINGQNGGSVSVCPGVPAQLNASGAINYSWLPSTGLFPTTGTPVTANPTANTTYTLTGTDGDGCSNTATISVNLSPAPTITVNPSSTSLCSNQPVSLTAGGAVTYNWNPSSGLNQTIGTTVIANPSSSVTYTVTGTDANGCTGKAYSSITVNTAPDVSISAVPSTICGGGSTTLTATGADNYVWTPTAVLPNNTSNPVTHTPSGTTVYTVIGTGPNGCKDTAYATVSVSGGPTISSSPSNPTICLNDSVQITISGGSTYLWTPQAGLSNTTGSSAYAKPASTTVYTIVGADAIGCTNMTTVTVNVLTLPTVTVTPDTSFLCPGESVTLTASGASDFSWSPAYNLAPTTGAVVVASPMVTTNYTVTGSGGNGCNHTAVAKVSVSGIPAIVFNPPNPAVCEGSSVFVTTSGGSTYNWNPSATVTPSTGNAVTISPVASTTYTVNGLDTNGCPYVETVLVTVSTQPVADPGTNNLIACGSGPIVIGTTALPGLAYSWTPSTGLNNPNIAQPLANPTLTTTYTLVVSDTTGGANCQASATHTVTVTNVPVADAGSNHFINCGDPPVIIGIVGDAQNSYSWSPVLGLSDPNIAQPTASPSTATNYTLTVTNTTSGCQATDFVVVDVLNTPLANAGVDQSISCGSLVPVSIGEAATSGYIYSWSPATGLNNAGIANPTALPSSTTTYIVTATDTVSGCYDTDNVVVTVLNTPVVPSLVNKSINCGATGAYIGVNNNTNYSYQWSPATGLGSPTVSNPYAQPSITTSYSLTVTDNVSGCQFTDQMTLTVLNTPSIPVLADKTVDCNGSAVAIGYVGSPAYSYSWSPSTGLNDPSASNPEALPANTTTYILTVTDTTSLCQSTENVVVTLLNTPSFPALTDRTIDCGVSGVNIGVATLGGYSYSWTPSTGLNNANISNPYATPTLTTSYTLTVTDTSSFCQRTDDLLVTVLNTPSITPMVDKTINCGQSGVVIGVASQSGLLYSWTPTAGLSNPNISSPTAQPTGTTIYTLTVTDSVSLCQSTDDVRVTVLNTPSLTPLSDKSINCGATSGVYIGVAAIAGYAYQWSPASGLDNPNTSNPNANPSITTVYTLVVTDTSSLCQTTDDVRVTVLNTPAVPAITNKTIDCGLAGIHIGVAAISGYNYSWSPTTSLSNPASSNPYANPSSNTLYTLTVTDSISLCQSSNSITVTVLNSPTISPLADKTIDCGVGSVSIGTATQLGYIYSWTPTAGLDNAGISNPNASPNITTNYTLTVTDSVSGCYATDDVRVIVLNTPAIPALTDKSINCGDTGVYIGIAATSGYSYSWNPAAGLNNPNVANPLAMPTGSTNYTLVITDISSGCQSSEDMWLMVLNTPSVPPLPNTAVDCGGDSVQIGLAAVSGYTYSWSPSAGLSSPSVSNPMARPGSTTQYTLTVSDAISGCQVVRTQLVTVNNAPVLPLLPDRTIDCGQSAIHIGTAAVSGYAYQWSPTTALVNPTDANPLANPGMTTNYTLLVTDLSSMCQVSQDVLVTVNGTPANPNLPDQTISCGGSAVGIGYSGSTAYFYNWSPAAGLNNPASSNPLAEPNLTTSYTLTITDTLSFCQTVDIVTVTVLNTPAHPNLTDKSINCGVVSGVSIGVANDPNYGYNWSPPTGLSNPAVSNPSANPGSSISYTLVITDNSSGCQVTDDVYVTVLNTPVLPALADKTIDCGVGAVSIGTSGQAGFSYNWTPATWLDNPNQATVNATPVMTTTYTLVVTDTVSGCQASDDVLITVMGTPALNPMVDRSTLCGAGGIRLGNDSVAAYHYEWSPATWLDNPNSPYPWADPNASATYTLVVTDTVSGCQSTDDVAVYLLNAPSVPSLVDKTMICGAAGVYIGIAQVSGQTYQWTPVNYLDVATASNPFANPPTTTNYSLVITDDISGCQATDEMTVFVTGVPLAQAGQDQTIQCNAAGVGIGASGYPGYAYNWSPATGLSNDTIANPVAQPGGTTVYTLTVTDIFNGCYATDAVTITVINTPIANAGLSQSINCLAPVAVYIGTPGVFGYDYQWSPAAGLDDPYLAQPEANPQSTTTYVLTVTDNSTSCYGTDEVTVFVLGRPVVDIIGSAQSCGGTDVNLVAFGTNLVAPYTYAWSHGPTTQNVTVQPGSTMIYTVVITNANGCMGSDTHELVINPTPVVDLGPDLYVAPFPMTISSNISGGTTPFTYAWSTGDTSANLNITPMVDTTVFLTLTDAAGCSAIDTINIYIVPIPMAIAYGDTTVCSGDTIQLYGTVISGTPPYTFYWSTGDTGQYLTAIPGGNTHYIFYVKDSFNIIAADTVFIQVFSNPTVFAGNDTTVCFADTIVLTAVSPGATSFFWSNGSNTATTTVSPSDTSIYTITVTNSIGCRGTDEVAVNILPYDQPEITASGPIGFCDGVPVDVTLTAESGHASYLWTPGNETSQSIHVTQPGNYQVWIIDQNNCDIPSMATIVVSTPPIHPHVIALGPVPFCEDTSVILILSEQYHTYLWSSGSTTADIKVTENGNYHAFVSTIHGCSGYSDTLQVQVDALPVAYFGHLDSATKVSLYNYSLYASSYFWDFGDGNTSTAAQPVHYYAAAGTYDITLIANNSCGTDTFVIQVQLNSIGFAEQDEMSSLKVFPNPATDYLYVLSDFSESLEIKIELVDMTGRIIMTEENRWPGGLHSYTISTEGLSRGLYMLKLDSPQDRFVFRIAIH